MDLSNPRRVTTTKRRKKKDTTPFVVEAHDVLGKAKVLRTVASGKVYQFRMWIEDEKKYVRKTLKTKDLNVAMQRAKDEVFRISGEKHSGKKIFGQTLSELVDRYLVWRKQDVEGGLITQQRHDSLRSEFKHFLEFMGASLKLSELEKNSCYDYAQFRRSKSPKIRDETIKNAQSTINHMMKYAYRTKMINHFETFEFRKISRKSTQPMRRSVFELEEYDRLVLFMRSWASKKNCDDKQVLAERLMIKDCLLIASNTMLRVGELWQLRWDDIRSFQEKTDSRNKKLILVTIRVRSEISKVRRERLITVRGGEYFRRLYERTPFKDHNDYVFCGESGQERFKKIKFYAAWRELMSGIGIDYKKRNLSWYSLRHFGITCRLRAGASVFDVANIAGTSIAHIQSNYGHFDQRMSVAASLLNFSYDEEGLSLVEN
jgi:integrase